MANRKRKDIEKSLTKKGFVLTESDHRYYSFIVDGKEVAKTKVSHGTHYNVIDDGLISRMSHQCNLSKAEFLELVDCTMSQEQYMEILRGKGHLK